MRCLGRCEGLVEPGGRDPPVIGLDGVRDRREEALYAEAGLGRDAHHGCVAEKPEFLRHLIIRLQSLVGREQVPFVEEDDYRAAGGVDSLRQALVLVGDSLARIEHKKGHVGMIEGSERPDEGVILGASPSRARRRIPAVSTRRSEPAGLSITVSMASRVVPGRS